MMGCYLPLSEQRSNDIRDGLRDEVNAMSKKGTGRVTRVYCAFEKTTDTVVGFAKWLPGSYSGGSYYYGMHDELVATNLANFSLNTHKL